MGQVKTEIAIDAPMQLQDVITQKLVLTVEGLKDTQLLKQIQTRLEYLNLYHGKVDGLWGPRTQQAIAQFCKDHHLNNYQTGEYGPTWAKALNDARRELITEAQAESIFGRSILQSHLADLNSCLVRFEINTPGRLRHFMSQIAHESAGCKYLKELASGDAYEGRRDLGNTQKGDGRRFKGGGALQVTGRANYQALCNYLNDPRVMEGCSYVSQNLPFTASGHWWMRNHMNALCDQGGSVEQVTRRVNGGVNGLSDRKMYYIRACKVIPG